MNTDSPKWTTIVNFEKMHGAEIMERAGAADQSLQRSAEIVGAAAAELESRRVRDKTIWGGPSNIALPSSYQHKSVLVMVWGGALVAGAGDLGLDIES
jgi:hypothetical protein